MATAGDILTVRRNTDEIGSITFDDTVVGQLIDANGVDVASAIIWRWKAASYHDQVSVSEAGASHSFSELHRNALDQAKLYASFTAVDGPRAAKVSIINRRRL